MLYNNAQQKQTRTSQVVMRDRVYKGNRRNNLQPSTC